MMLEPRPLQSEAGGSVAPLGIDDEGEAPPSRFSPEEQRLRRAKFGRYVKWTMGACVALSLAGIARRFVVDPDASADEPRVSQAALAPAVPAEPSSSPPPVPAVDIPTIAVTALPTSPADPKEAKREKKAAKAALDKGKADAAIAAASRSASLDPTDAEAWLVLGAAYMEKRDVVSARHAFADCGKNATHGPKNECAAMLR